MKHLLAASLVAFTSLSACSILGKGPHVPGDYAGTTQITVANAGDRELCMFAIFAGSPNGVDNWLGEAHKKENIAPGARRTFSIKPGVYHVVGGFCDGETLLAAVGTYGEATKSIEGPTLIALGPKPVTPDAGEAMLRFTKLHAINTGGGGGGDDSGAEEPAAAEEPATTETPSSTSSEAPAKAPASCNSSGGTCGFENDYPCCAGTTCTGVDAHGHGTCR